MPEQTLNLLTPLFGFLCSLPTACREKVKISKLINVEYMQHLTLVLGNFLSLKEMKHKKLVKKKTASLKHRSEYRNYNDTDK